MTKAGRTKLFNHFHMKKSTCSAVGIDISSETFDVFLAQTEATGIHKVFTNDLVGTKKCITFLKKKAFSGKVVMESTGRYHFLCAIMLKESGFNVFVVNPLTVKKYQTARIRKCKTDKQDAKLLAQVALLENNLPLFTKDRIDLVIRQKISTIKSLEKALQKLNSSISNYKRTIEALGSTMTPAEESIMETIKCLKKQKEALESEVTKQIKAKYGAIAMDRLQSIPGVSPFLSALMIFFFHLDEGIKASKWVAFCGLEVSIHQSGKWKGFGRLSKRGNKYLRKRLFSGAWGAFMHDENFKNYYYELKEGGRGHVEALNILSRKMVRIAFALLKNGSFFDHKKCF